MTYVLSSAPGAPEAPLSLPPAPDPRKRSTIPLAAAIVPILGGLGMYAMTRSPIALMFAALGPVMLLASLLDGARGRRADRRRYQRAIRPAVETVRRQIDAQHEAERAVRWRTHPDARSLSQREEEVWRAHPGREGTIVVGAGETELAMEVARGVDTPEAGEIRAYAARLSDVPLVIPLDGLLCVRAVPLVARAVVRALVVQACSTHGPDALRVVLGENCEEWMQELPHVRFSVATRVLTIGSVDNGADTAGITWCGPDEIPPSGCRTVLEVDTDTRGTLIRDSWQRELDAEALSVEQASAFASHLASKSSASRSSEPTVFFHELAHRKGTAREALPIVLGRAGSAAVEVDIVTDGPHGVVVGTTGSGKSELLVSWALALCATYTPQEVTLLLADFKGGTAFEPLAGLEHVTGILTDLNGAMAKRAMLSLQAEVRRREGAIADVGARDITDVRVDLPRLIIMVDEFAALVRQLPELEAVFTDIAARGRALGMHLILGAQRAAGAIREATLANTPLRIALRVTDGADSRAIIGTDLAAQISGGVEGKGVAFVRRASDAVPQRFRSALSSPDDLQRLIAAQSAARGTEHAGGSWWDPLPTSLSAAELPSPARGIALGVADDIENLRRVPVVIEPGVERGWWVIGGPRTGKSALASLIASRCPGALQMPADLESAWDALIWLESNDARLIIWDDVDAALAGWQEPWGREATERLERLVRMAGSRNQTWVLTAQRASGALSRIADLLPGRVLFAVPSKLDHVAAGGGGQDHDPKRPPGRALMAGADVQFALAPPTEPVRYADPAPTYRPTAGLVGIVSRGIGAQRTAIDGWRADCEVLTLAECASGTPLPEAARVVLIGDAEEWQRAYSLLERVKREGEVLVATDCIADLRILGLSRSTPPYAVHGRWWLMRQGEPARRATV